MFRRSIELIIITLFVTATFGCSMLRPKRPLIWHITIQVDPAAGDRDAVTRQTVAIIESRLNAFGVPNFNITPTSGLGPAIRLVVYLPEVQDRDRVKNILTAGGKLELDAVVSPPHPEPAKVYGRKEEAEASLASENTQPPNRRVLVYPNGASAASQSGWVVVETPAIVDGSELKNAIAVAERSGGTDYDIQFSLNKSGAARLSNWTGANINRYLAVVLNDQVVSIAFVRGQIYDQGVISGRFSKSSAEDLALVLKSGGYPAPVKLVEEGDNK